MNGRIVFAHLALASAAWAAAAAAAAGAATATNTPKPSKPSMADFAKPSASEPVTAPAAAAYKAKQAPVKLAVPAPKPSPAPKSAPAAPKPAPKEDTALASVEAYEKSVSQPMYRRFVHPAAKAIVGLDLTRIQDSTVGKMIMARAEAAGMKRKAAEAGMDFASDVERLLLSTPGEGAKGSLSEEAPFVVALQGKFKIDKLRKGLLAKRAQRFLHQGAEVWSPQDSDTSLAIVNSQVMLVGDRKSLRAVLDEQAGAASPSNSEESEANPVRRRAEDLSGLYDIWIVSEASLDELGGGSVPLPQAAEIFRQIDQLELGVSFRQGLVADVSFHGRTPEDTAKLAQALTGLKMMAALAAESRKNEQPELTKLLDKLKIGLSGDRAAISRAFSREDLDQAVASALNNTNKGGAGKSKAKPAADVQSAKSGSASPATVVEPPAPAKQPQQTAVAAAAPAPPPPPAAPARKPAPPPLVVRIYNAEGGTREVPLAR